MGADFGDDASEALTRAAKEIFKKILQEEWNKHNQRQAARDEYFKTSDYRGFRDAENSQGEPVSQFALTTEDERDGVLKYLKDKNVEVEPVDANMIVFNKKDMGQVEEAVKMYREDLVAASEIEKAELKAIEQAMYAMDDAIDFEKVLDEQIPLPQKCPTREVPTKEVDKVLDNVDFNQMKDLEGNVIGETDVAQKPTASKTSGSQNKGKFGMKQPTSLKDRAKNAQTVSKALEQGKNSVVRDKMIDKAVPSR